MLWLVTIRDEFLSFIDLFHFSARQKEIEYECYAKDKISLIALKKSPRKKGNEASADDNEDFHSTSKQQHYSAGQTELIKLAMFWDCIRIAKELIFKNSLKNVAVSIFERRKLNIRHLV